MKNIRQALIAGVMFLLLLPAAAYGVTWTTNERLTNNAGFSFSSEIAVDGQNIYVVWNDNTTGNEEIYFKKGVLKNIKRGSFPGIPRCQNQLKRN